MPQTAEVSMTKAISRPEEARLATEGSKSEAQEVPVGLEKSEMGHKVEHLAKDRAEEASRFSGQEISYETASLMRSTQFYDASERVFAEIPQVSQEKALLEAIAVSQDAAELTTALSGKSESEIAQALRDISSISAAQRAFSVEDDTLVQNLVRRRSDSGFRSSVLTEPTISEAELSIHEQGKASTSSQAVLERRARPQEAYEELETTLAKSVILKEARRLSAAREEDKMAQFDLIASREKPFTASTVTVIPRTEAQLMTQASQEETKYQEAKFSHPDVTKSAQSTDIALASSNLADASRQTREFSVDSTSLVHSYDFVDADSRVHVQLPYDLKESSHISSRASTMEQRDMSEDIRRAEIFEMLDVARKLGLEQEVSQTFGIDEKTTLAELSKIPSEEMAHVIARLFLDAKEKGDFREFGRESSEVEAVFVRASRPSRFDETQRSTPELKTLQEHLKTRAASVETAIREIGLQGIREEMLEARLSRTLPREEAAQLQSLASREESLQASTSLAGRQDYRTTEGLFKSKSTSDARFNLREARWEDANLIHEYRSSTNFLTNLYDYVEAEFLASGTIPQKNVEQLKLQALASKLEMAQFEDEVSSKYSTEFAGYSMRETPVDSASREFSTDYSQMASNLMKSESFASYSTTKPTPYELESSGSFHEYGSTFSAAEIDIRRLPKPPRNGEMARNLPTQRGIQYSLTAKAASVDIMETEVDLSEKESSYAQEYVLKQIPTTTQSLSSLAASEITTMAEARLALPGSLQGSEALMQTAAQIEPVRGSMREFGSETAHLVQKTEFVEVDTQAHAVLPEMHSTQAQLRSMAPSTEVQELIRDIKAPETTSETTLTSSLHLLESTSKGFGIDHKEISAEITKIGPLEKSESRLKIGQKTETSGQAKEYEIADSTLAFTLQKVVRPSEYAESDIILEESRLLAQKMATLAASEDTTLKEYLLERLTVPEAQAVYEKILARREAISLASRAAGDEARSAETSLAYQITPEEVLKVLKSVNLEESYAKLKETTLEEASSALSHEILEVDARKIAYLPQEIREKLCLQAKSASEIKLEIEKEIQKAQETGDTARIQRLVALESSIARFGVDEKALTEGFVKAFEEEILKKILSDATKEEIEARLREFGKTEAETEAIWSRQIRPAVFEESEVSLSILSQAQEVLSTKAVGEARLEKEVELSPSGPKGALETTSTQVMVRKDVVELSGKATEEVTKVQEAVLSQKETLEASETSLKAMNIEQATSRLPETSQESRSLSKYVDVIENQAQTQKFLPESVKEQAYLTSTAVSEATISMDSTVTPRPDQVSAEVKIEPLKLAETTTRQFAVAPQAFEIKEFAKIADTRQEVAVVSEIRIQKEAQKVHEFGEEAVEVEGVWSRLARPGSEQYRDVIIPSERRLEDRLQTKATTSEETSSEAQIQASRMALDSTEFYQRGYTTTQEYAEGTFGKEDLGIGRYFYGEHPKLKAQTSLEISSTEGFRTSVREASEDIQNLSSTLEIVETDLAAQKLVSDQEKESMSLKTSAPSLSEASRVQEIQRKDVSLEASQVRAEKEAIREGRTFGARQESTEKIFEAQKVQISSEKILSETTKEAMSSIKFTEIQSADVNSAAYLCKITSSRRKKEHAEASIPISRSWKEELRTKAAEVEEEVKDLTLDVPSEEATSGKKFKEKTVEIIHYKTPATREATIQTIDEIRSSQVTTLESIPTTIKASNQERAFDFFKEASAELHSLSSDWRTVLNELEFELIETDMNFERAQLRTKAVSDSVVTASASIEQPMFSSVHDITMDLKSHEEQERRFTVEVSELTRQFASSGSSEVFKQRLQEVRTLPGSQIDLIESTSEDINAGVLLVRMPLKKKDQQAAHIMDVSANVAQVLRTQHASDVATESSVEWSGRESTSSVDLTVKSRHEQAEVFQGAYAKEITSQKHIDLLKNDQKAVSEKTVTSARIEKSAEKFKEVSDEGAIEISQWTTVLRDAEATAELKHRLNVVQKLTTLEATEETTCVNEQWQAGEAKMIVQTTRPEEIRDSNERSFKIEISGQETDLKKPTDVKSEADKTIDIPRSETMTWKIKESGDAKLHATVNLHRVEVPSKTAAQNELCVSDFIRISAPPLQVPSSDMATFYLDEHLQKPMTSAQAERLLKAKNWCQPVEYEAEESTEEKTKLAIDLQGKVHVSDRAGTTVKIPNTADRISLSADEFEEDEALLYAQINSRDTKHIDEHHTVSIPRHHEPILLRSKASTEEKQVVNEQWEIAEGREFREKTFWVPFRGQDLAKTFQESTHRSVQVGFVYDRETPLLETSRTSIDVRYGGNYHLNALAAGREDRNIALNLSQRLQAETIRGRFKHRTKSELSMHLLESTQENMATNYNFERAASFESVFCRQICANETEPLFKKCLESIFVSDTVNYEFKTPESKDLTTSTKDISNFGGAFKLKTDAAEDIKLDVERELRRDEEFHVFEKTVIDFNAAPGQVLRTYEPTSETFVANNAYIRPQEDETASLKIVDKNRGQDVVLRTRETTDVTQTNYVEFKQPEEKETLEKTILEARKGGDLRLKTSAAEFEEILCLRELEKDRIEVVHVEKTTLVPNEAAPVSLFSPSTTQTERYLQSAVVKSPEHERVARLFKARNELSTTLHVVESRATECTANFAYKIDESYEISETLIHIPQSGGKIELSTPASGGFEWKHDFSLTKKREADLGAKTRLKTFNTIAPVALNAKETKWDETSIGEQWVKEQASLSTETLRIIGNVGAPASLTIRESTSVEEYTNLQWSRPEAKKESSKTLLEARFGGSFHLRTGHAKEETVELRDNHLVAKVIDQGAAELVKKTANVQEPVFWSTKASTSKEVHHGANLFHADEEEKVGIVQKAANQDFAQMRIRESEAHHETTNAMFRRLEEAHEAQKTIVIPRFGGQALLQTSHPKDRTIELPVDLRVDAPGQLDAAITLNIPRTPDQAPFLRTGRVTDVETSTQQHLLRKPDLEDVGIVRDEPFRGSPASLHVRESKSVEETINCQWAREPSNLEFVEVKYEPRFGGAVSLGTKAAGDESVQISRDLDKGGARELDSDITIVEKRVGSPEKLDTYAVKTSDTTVTTNLQRPDESEAAAIKTDVPRTIDGQSVRVTETSEIEQVNNIMLKRPEAAEASDKTLQEPRYGGAAYLVSKHASTQEVQQDKVLSRSESQESTELRIKTANTTEPVLKSCGHSTQEEVSNSWSLESSKVFQGQTTIVLASPNKIPPVELRSTESESVSTTTNVAIQNQKRNEAEKEITLPMPKYGGGYTIHTSAAKQAEGGEVVMNLARRQEDLETTLVTKIAGEGEPVKMDVSAAGEEVANVEVNYQKQQQESKLEWTGTEVRKEPRVEMKSTATKDEYMEVVQTEVRRRLAEVEVEGVTKTAQTAEPVVLNTEYAAETIIRTDAILESDARRHRDELAKEVAIARTEILEEVFTSEDAEKVRLRRGYYNADEKKEPEKPEEELTEEEKVRLRRGYYNAAEEKERERESKEKRVSFAADVTEKTMDLDMEMSMSVEERNKPSIIKKPMKKERERRRRDDLRKNEAPSFAPVRRNSLLMALNIGSPHNLPRFKTLDDIIRAIKEAGLEYSNLIFGIDYTRSNFYQGERTFDCKSLHHIGGEEPNPYQQVIEIVGKTLSSFDADGMIPAYGFGDEECTDHAIFNLVDRDDLDADCEGFQEVLRVYNEVTPTIKMSGPTNFVPLIEKAVDICRSKHSYHILVIVADGQVTNEKINQRAIAAASHYPLSIIMVGVGDGPWDMMTRFDETLPKRIFDNFHFVDFHKVMFNAPNPDASFALNALMEIPDQYKAIKELGLLKPSRRG